ncbi:uncharacterized protein LOC101863610 [Aplysia californica]|uniref:Uncharacterized protein LOC101863610 n=1 Tax=Aplysia californica TaxID=6500 RepID=A0ABM1W039_APLCA|nr:uncharacterized protein LOC101863610 [Aplysia californica]
MYSGSNSDMEKKYEDHIISNELFLSEGVSNRNAPDNITGWEESRSSMYCPLKSVSFPRADREGKAEEYINVLEEEADDEDDDDEESSEEEEEDEDKQIWVESSVDTGEMLISVRGKGNRLETMTSSVDGAIDSADALKSDWNKARHTQTWQTNRIMKSLKGRVISSVREGLLSDRDLPPRPLPTPSHLQVVDERGLQAPPRKVASEWNALENSSFDQAIRGGLDGGRRQRFLELVQLPSRADRSKGLSSKRQLHRPEKTSDLERRFGRFETASDIRRRQSERSRTTKKSADLGSKESGRWLDKRKLKPRRERCEKIIEITDRCGVSYQVICKPFCLASANEAEELAKWQRKKLKKTQEKPPKKRLEKKLRGKQEKKLKKKQGKKLRKKQGKKLKKMQEKPPKKRLEKKLRGKQEKKKEAEEKARKEAEEKAKKEAEKKARKAAEEKARKEAEEKARREAEEKAKKEAEEKAKKEAEEKARKEAEEKARKAAEEKAKREAEEKAKKEAEEKARRAAEEKARKEAEEKARKEAEEKARKEAEEKARKEAEEKARKEAEEKARKEAEEKARKEAEEKARKEAEEKARKEAEEKAKKEAEEKARKEAEEKARKEAEEKARKEAEEKARKEAEEKARKEAAERARKEAEEKALKAAEDNARKAAEAKARREARAAAFRATVARIKDLTKSGASNVAMAVLDQLELIKRNNEKYKFPQRRGLYVPPQAYPIWLHREDKAKLLRLLHAITHPFPERKESEEEDVEEEEEEEVEEEEEEEEVIPEKSSSESTLLSDTMPNQESGGALKTILRALARRFTMTEVPLSQILKEQQEMEDEDMSIVSGDSQEGDNSAVIPVEPTERSERSGNVFVINENDLLSTAAPKTDALGVQQVNQASLQELPSIWDDIETDGMSEAGSDSAETVIEVGQDESQPLVARPWSSTVAFQEQGIDRIMSEDLSQNVPMLNEEDFKTQQRSQTDVFEEHSQEETQNIPVVVQGAVLEGVIDKSGKEKPTVEAERLSLIESESLEHKTKPHPAIVNDGKESSVDPDTLLSHASKREASDSFTRKSGDKDPESSSAGEVANKDSTPQRAVTDTGSYDANHPGSMPRKSSSREEDIAHVPGREKSDDVTDTAGSQKRQIPPNLEKEGGETGRFDESKSRGDAEGDLVRDNEEMKRVLKTASTTNAPDGEGDRATYYDETTRDISSTGLKAEEYNTATREGVGKETSKDIMKETSKDIMKETSKDKVKEMSKGNMKEKDNLGKTSKTSIEETSKDNMEGTLKEYFAGTSTGTIQEAKINSADALKLIEQPGRDTVKGHHGQHEENVLLASIGKEQQKRVAVETQYTEGVKTAGSSQDQSRLPPDDHLTTEETDESSHLASYFLDGNVEDGTPNKSTATNEESKAKGGPALVYGLDTDVERIKNEGKERGRKTDQEKTGNRTVLQEGTSSFQRTAEVQGRFGTYKKTPKSELLLALEKKSRKGKSQTLEITEDEGVGARDSLIQQMISRIEQVPKSKKGESTSKDGGLQINNLQTQKANQTGLNAQTLAAQGDGLRVPHMVSPGRGKKQLFQGSITIDKLMKVQPFSKQHKTTQVRNPDSAVFLSEMEECKKDNSHMEEYLAIRKKLQPKITLDCILKPYKNEKSCFAKYGKSNQGEVLLPCKPNNYEAAWCRLQKQRRSRYRPNRIKLDRLLSQNEKNDMKDPCNPQKSKFAKHANPSLPSAKVEEESMRIIKSWKACKRKQEEPIIDCWTLTGLSPRQFYLDSLPLYESEKYQKPHEDSVIAKFKEQLSVDADKPCDIASLCPKLSLNIDEILKQKPQKKSQFLYGKCNAEDWETIKNVRKRCSVGDKREPHTLLLSKVCSDNKNLDDMQEFIDRTKPKLKLNLDDILQGEIISSNQAAERKKTEEETLNRVYEMFLKPRENNKTCLEAEDHTTGAEQKKLDTTNHNRCDYLGNGRNQRIQDTNQTLLSFLDKLKPELSLNIDDILAHTGAIDASEKEKDKTLRTCYRYLQPHIAKETKVQRKKKKALTTEKVGQKSSLKIHDKLLQKEGKKSDQNAHRKPSSTCWSREQETRTFDANEVMSTVEVNNTLEKLKPKQYLHIDDILRQQETHTYTLDILRQRETHTLDTNEVMSTVEVNNTLEKLKPKQSLQIDDILSQKKIENKSKRKSSNVYGTRCYNAQSPFSERNSWTISHEKNKCTHRNPKNASSLNMSDVRERKERNKLHKVDKICDTNCGTKQLHSLNEALVLNSQTLSPETKVTTPVKSDNASKLNSNVEIMSLKSTYNTKRCQSVGAVTREHSNITWSSDLFADDRLDGEFRCHSSPKPHYVRDSGARCKVDIHKGLWHKGEESGGFRGEKMTIEDAKSFIEKIKPKVGINIDDILGGLAT